MGGIVYGMQENIFQVRPQTSGPVTLLFLTCFIFPAFGRGKRLSFTLSGCPLRASSVSAPATRAEYTLEPAGSASVSISPISQALFLLAGDGGVVGCAAVLRAMFMKMPASVCMPFFPVLLDICF